jgi:hypothetical protein
MAYRVRRNKDAVFFQLKASRLKVFGVFLPEGISAKRFTPR